MLLRGPKSMLFVSRALSMETLAQQNSMSRCDTADAKVNLTKIPHLVDLRFISRAAVIAFSVPEFSLS